MSAFKELKRVRSQLEKAEGKADELRERRNQLIYQAIENEGKTEREAAEAAGVSSAYAHRVRRSNGHPPSGTMLTRSAE